MKGLVFGGGAVAILVALWLWALWEAWAKYLLPIERWSFRALLDRAENVEHRLDFSSDFFIGSTKGPYVRKRLNAELGRIRDEIARREEATSRARHYPPRSKAEVEAAAKAVIEWDEDETGDTGYGDVQYTTLRTALERSTRIEAAAKFARAEVAADRMTAFQFEQYVCAALDREDGRRGR
jgi:hypothetical protein